MRATMQTLPLTIADLFEHGERVHADARITDYLDGRLEHRTFADVADEARRLATALADLGVGADDVVATLCWNTSHHVAAYFAVPSSGAVLHTLNLRLHPSQLSYIARHARDRVILVDEDLLPMLLTFVAEVPTVCDIIVIGALPAELPDGVRFHVYDDLVNAAEPTAQWPALTEEQAAVLCYTTGTTGDPKGVAYSHRSTYLHTLMISTGSAYGFSDVDRALPAVPMFHANAWGWVHAAWIAGTDLVMSGRYLQAPHIASMIDQLRPTMLAAVPTIWSALSRHSAAEGVDLTCLRVAVSGGSPLSPALAREVQENNQLTLTQGWGMTETSPLLTFSRPPAGTPAEEIVTWTTRTGRLVPGVQARIVAEDGEVQPWDGVSQGEVEVAGNSITGAYLGIEDTAGSQFRDGWLRTGDLGVIHPGGWVQLKDRLKDGIKSGGEWISTVELENAIAEHPDVLEVAVVGVPDPTWEERPHAFVVAADRSDLDGTGLAGFLEGKVAKWWIPEKWTFAIDLPKTSVGKIDKSSLRNQI
ncbi:long-chain-fatty-acid--CoA ligase [Pseudonocardia hispaniensis]|uniref:Long-chain-fatty-acid--CoA ligase n=1 Tax=Pseudonocardia hispaniensis TaxID=904933 RepID=A0ABW1IWH6_9PSEU